MKVLVHAVVPLYVEVDTETRRVLRAVVDIEDFKYEDPPLTSDVLGGPAPGPEADVAYDVATESESEWLFSVRIVPPFEEAFT